MIKKTDSLNIVPVIENIDLNIPDVKNGEISITDTIEFDRGSYDDTGEIIQTVTRIIKRKIKYKNNKPVTVEEIVDEKISTIKRPNRNMLFIEASVVD